MEQSNACLDFAADTRSHLRTTSPHGGSTAADALLLMGVDPADELQAACVPLALRRLSAGDPLFHEGSPANALYLVRAGTFKIFRTAHDGYEHVVDFTVRTELLGFDAICTGVHPSTAVALEESSVYAVPLRDLDELAREIPALARIVNRAVSHALVCRSDVTEMMAAVAAEVRLARFLMLWSRRMAAQGQSPRRLRLRMSRRDMASNMGVAHETVSRAFGALAQAGLVRVENREVEILDSDALAAFASSTRRNTDDGVAAAAPVRAVRKVANRRSVSRPSRAADGARQAARSNFALRAA